MALFRFRLLAFIFDHLVFEATFFASHSIGISLNRKINVRLNNYKLLLHIQSSHDVITNNRNIFKPSLDLVVEVSLRSDFPSISFLSKEVILSIYQLAGLMIN